MWYGPDRPKWLGPLPFDYPAHLRGELPGDYGYDPLSLGREPAKLDRYFELELLHARWAMLGALGALLPGWCGGTLQLSPSACKEWYQDFSERTVESLVRWACKLWLMQD